MRIASAETTRSRDFSLMAWVGLLLMLPVPARAEEGEAAGRFVSVPSSLSGDTIKRVLQTTELEFTRYKQAAKDPGGEKWKDFKIVFDFNPDGKPAASDEHELCLMLANGIRRLEQAGAPTTAFVHGDVSRHSVLPVLACRQIVMSTKAKIGPVLRSDSPPLSKVEKESYRDLATRLSSPDLIEKLFDKDLLIVPGKKGGWVDARKADEAAGGRPLFESGKPAVFDFAKAKEIGLCELDPRDSREELARAYRMDRRSMQDNPLLLEKPVVWRITVAGEVNGALEENLKRKLRKATGQKANVILLELKCHDGDTAVANSLGEYLRKFNDDRPDHPVEIVAHVTEQAQDTAVPLALGCSYIVIDPKASLGGFGKLLRHRTDDDVRTIGESLAALAEKQAYPKALARAFVDRGVENLFYVTSTKGARDWGFFTGRQLDEERKARPGYWGPGEEIVLDTDRLLTLSADDAVRFGLAYKKGDLESIYRDKGVKASEVHVSGADWIDDLADFLRNDWTKYLLIMIGITCLFLELKMPGVGVPGIIAAVCFVLFFWSHSQIGGGQVVWLAVLLFLLGLVLLGIELFILPGFGVCGISGILLILGSLGLVVYGHWPQDGSEWGALTRKLAPFGMVLMGSVALTILLARYLPSIPYVKGLLLRPQSEDAEGGDVAADSRRESMMALLGAIGVAATPLRPAGKVQFGEQYVDVVAEGSYVVPGTRVQVIEIEGNRVVVKAV